MGVSPPTREMKFKMQHEMKPKEKATDFTEFAIRLSVAF
jgi:hypothetical protein